MTPACGFRVGAEPAGARGRAAGPFLLPIAPSARLASTGAALVTPGRSPMPPPAPPPPAARRRRTIPVAPARRLAPLLPSLPPCSHLRRHCVLGRQDLPGKGPGGAPGAGQGWRGGRLRLCRLSVCTRAQPHSSSCAPQHPALTPPTPHPPQVLDTTAASQAAENTGEGGIFANSAGKVGAGGAAGGNMIPWWLAAARRRAPRLRPAAARCLGGGRAARSPCASVGQHPPALTLPNPRSLPVPSHPQAEADPATLASSQAFLAKLRDELLAANGVKPGNVKLVPLPTSIASCARGGRWAGRVGRWEGRSRRRALLPPRAPGRRCLPSHSHSTAPCCPHLLQPAMWGAASLITPPMPRPTQW